MHEDNLLCLRKAAFVRTTTDSRHGWRVVPNLARGMELSGLDQLWVADITYIHLAEDFGKAHDIQPSMSRVGNPYDNAKAESFMKTLKQEDVDGAAYRNVAEA